MHPRAIRMSSRLTSWSQLSDRWWWSLMSRLKLFQSSSKSTYSTHTSLKYHQSRRADRKCKLTLFLERAFRSDKEDMILKKKNLSRPITFWRRTFIHKNVTNSDACLYKSRFQDNLFIMRSWYSIDCLISLRLESDALWYCRLSLKMMMIMTFRRCTYQFSQRYVLTVTK